MRNDRVGLDLDQCSRVDQFGDLDHGRGRPDRLEKLAVDFADLSPLGDVSDVDPRANDVGSLAAQGLDRGDDDLERPAGCALTVGANCPSASIPTVPVTKMKSPERTARE